jgi:HipA-like kinase
VSAQAIFPGVPALPGASQLEAIQHVRRLRGGSQAQLMRASDRQYWVVKLRGNAQHDRILANEFLASRLGQLLGLPIPEVEIIELSDWLIRHTPELCLQLAGYSKPFQAGLHFASRFAGDPESAPTFDYLPESLFPSVLNRSDFPRMLVLDKWTSNADGRQAVFTKLIGRKKYAVHFIDQGYSFNAGEWNFPDCALHGVYYRNYVYSEVTSWDSFEPALTTAEEMDEQEIWQCAAPIPSEWCEPNPGELPRLVEVLYRRRSKIRDLITGFRESNRNPFPHWVAESALAPSSLLY